jgi:hypothetical protein
MAEFQLNRNNIDDAHHWLIELLNDDPYLILEAKNPVIGKWSMSRLFHSWCATAGEWMAQNGSTMPLYMDSKGVYHGKRKFNESDAKMLFSSAWFTDNNGDLLSWSKGGQKAKNGKKAVRAGNRGERYHCCNMLQQWMIERGIKHLNPRDSDYNKAMQEQNN